MAGPKALSVPDLNGLKGGVNAADGTDPGDLVNRAQLDANAVGDRARANHTGTQAATTISDFDTQVRTSRLDQLTAPTNPVQFNAQRGANVAAATIDSDVAQWGQVKDLLSGARKTDVRLVSGTQRALSGLTAIDGVTPVAGDRILLSGQTAPAENGIYVAASGSWTRATDADVSAEFATQWLVTVREGTVNSDTLWGHNTDGVVTLGTTALSFTKVGPISSSGATGYTTTCPAVAAGATWTVTHGLGTRAITAQVARTGSPYDFIGAVRIERDTTNTVLVKPDIALASGEYEIMIGKVA